MGKKRNNDGAQGDDVDDGRTKQAENWIDTIAGAAALGRRRLLRIVEAGDKRLLVYAGAKRLLVADCSSGALIDCEQPHSERVGALACHGGKVMVTGGDDKKLIVWDLPSMKVRSQTTTDKKIVAAVIDHSGSNVIFAEKAGEVFIKPVANPDAKGEHLLGHISSLTDMALSPSGQRLLTADRDEKIRISHYPHAFEIDAYCLGHTELATCMCVYVDSANKEERILSAGADGSLRLWRVADGELLDTHMLAEGSGGGGSGAAVGCGGAGKQEGEVSKAKEEDGGKGKAWDHLAAGTAEGTAAVSGRLRGKSEATPLVSLVQCVGTLGNVFAVAEEQSNVLVFVSTSGNGIAEVGRVELGGAPVGLAAVEVQHGKDGTPEGALCLIIAATFGDKSARIEACWLHGTASKVKAAVVERGGAGGQASALLKTVASMSEAVEALTDEAPQNDAAPASSAGQDQYMQKRRRHTEPGWKELHGKNASK